MWNPERLRQLVVACGKTRDQIAKDAGIGTATLLMAMDGRYTPSIDVMGLLADYFNVSLDYFVGRDEINLEEYPEYFKSMIRCAYEKSMWTRKDKKDLSGYKAPWPYNLIDDIYDEHTRNVLTEDQEAGLMYVLKRLSVREQDTLLKYYKDDKSMHWIAKDYNVTPERIRQIILKALRKLRSPNYLIYIEEGLQRQNDYLKEKHAITKRWSELMKENARLDELEANLNRRAQILNVVTMHEKTAMDKSWEEIIPDLSVRSFNCLRRSNIYTVGEIINLIENGEILKVRNLGRKSVNELIKKIRLAGYNVTPAEGVY